MTEGQSVRLVNDPGRTGELTGRSRSLGRRRLLQVRFPDGLQYVPEDQLELLDGGAPDPLELLARGKLAKAYDLRRTLTHVRLTGRLADLIYSMEVSNTDFYAFQFKPVLKMLAAPNRGLLVADEVGLGKTIEAGLIWTELRSRFDYRRLFVLCPAMLREKWRRELALRFGVDADVVDAREALATLRRAHRQGAYGHYAMVASIQGLRPSRGSDTSQELADYLHEIAYEEPAIDFLVVDEAHYLKNPESKSARLGRLLRRVAHHIALLSATPIHLGSQDLFHLLNLLDEDTFSHLGVFDSVLEANAPLLEARDAVLGGRVDADALVRLLQRAQEHPLLADNRQLEQLLETPPSEDRLDDHHYRSELAYRLENINLLGHTVVRTRKRHVKELRVVRDPVPEPISLSPPEAAFYAAVTDLVRRYCARYEAHEGFLLVTPQRQMSSSMPAALRAWQQRALDHWGEQLYEDLGDEAPPDAPGPLTQELLAQAHRLGDVDELWAHDSKYARLREVLTTFWGDYPDEKIVLFSYFRATLEYLSERLAEDGITSTVLMGGPGYDKDRILETFEQPGGPKILLSSEVASEGVDLQFCRVLINYDLPWNPMKIEQRIGRIDRIGQEADTITIWNLFYENTIDALIYRRLLTRLHVFQYALGGLEPVLGDEIRRLTIDLLRGELTTAQEEERIEQTAVAMAERQRQEDELEDEAAHLVAHGDYILNQVRASRRLQRWVSRDDIRTYVLGFFRSHYPGCEFVQMDDTGDRFEVSLTNLAKHDLAQYIREERLRERTFLTRNDPAPVECLFDNRLAARTPPHVEVINHLHPLVRFVSHRIDAQATGTEQEHYPAPAVAIDADLVEGLTRDVYVFAVQRWTTRGLRDEEQLSYIAVPLATPERPLEDEDAERLVLTAALQGRDWPEASNRVDCEAASEVALQHCLSALDERYETYVTDIKNRNNDLADVREKTLRDHLAGQRARLVALRDDLLRKAARSSGTYRQRLLNLARAREAQLEKLEAGVDRKLLDIANNREVETDAHDISVGLILVS